MLRASQPVTNKLIERKMTEKFLNCKLLVVVRLWMMMIIIMSVCIIVEKINALLQVL